MHPIQPTHFYAVCVKPRVSSSLYMVDFGVAGATTVTIRKLAGQGNSPAPVGEAYHGKPPVEVNEEIWLNLVEGPRFHTSFVAGLFLGREGADRAFAMPHLAPRDPHFARDTNAVREAFKDHIHCKFKAL